MSKKNKNSRKPSPFSKLKPDLEEAIEQALELGNLSIMPPSNHGKKKPFSHTWKNFQKKKATKKELKDWYEQGLTGFGLICGAISGNLECLDFDNKEVFSQFCQRMKDEGLTNLLMRLKNGYWERTPNGYHFLYRCKKIGKSKKLATRPKKEKK